ncbi:MAG: hypothetical protein ACLTUB_01875 [Bifidobacterium longum]
MPSSCSRPEAGRAADDPDANEFLAPAGMSCGRAVPSSISFDQASLDYEETINSLASPATTCGASPVSAWTLAARTTQLAAGNPGEYRGDRQAVAGIEGLIDAGYQSPSPRPQGTLARLKGAIIETGIASFDVIATAIDGFIDIGGEPRCSPNLT